MGNKIVLQGSLLCGDLKGGMDQSCSSEIIPNAVVKVGAADLGRVVYQGKFLRLLQAALLTPPQFVAHDFTINPTPCSV